MAIYTKLDKEKINSILSNYKLGDIKKFEGIKEGIENTNYLIETEKGKYILTIYEKRVDKDDLPFFSKLMLELSKKILSVLNQFQVKKTNTYLKLTFISY